MSGYLIHIGNKNSGRYPRGSGENPHQHDGYKSLGRPVHTKITPINIIKNTPKIAKQGRYTNAIRKTNIVFDKAKKRHIERINEVKNTKYEDYVRKGWYDKDGNLLDSRYKPPTRKQFNAMVKGEIAFKNMQLQNIKKAKMDISKNAKTKKEVMKIFKENRGLIYKDGNWTRQTTNY